MIRDIILKEKISERNRDRYLKAHPTWFEEMMNLKSKHAQPVQRGLSN